LTRLSEPPPQPKIPKDIGWATPILILSPIAYTSFANFDAGVQQSLSWLLWNGSFSALGAAVALGHPLTIIPAFVAAPLTSLNPLIAAGIVAGIVQACIRKPNVRDFENVSEDVFSIKGFWHNKVTRILLIVLL